MEKWNQNGTKFLIPSESLRGKPVVTCIQLTRIIHFVNLLIYYFFEIPFLANDPWDMHCFKMGSYYSVIRASPSPKETAFYWGWEEKVDRETIYWQKCKAYQHFLPGFYIWAFFSQMSSPLQAFCLLGSSTKKTKNCARFPPTYFIFSVFALLLTWPIMMLSIHHIKSLKQAGIVLVLRCYPLWLG